MRQERTSGKTISTRNDIGKNNEPLLLPGAMAASERIFDKELESTSLFKPGNINRNPPLRQAVAGSSNPRATQKKTMTMESSELDHLKDKEQIVADVYEKLIDELHKFGQLKIDPKKKSIRT